MKKRCEYPGKVRQPLSVQLTPVGHELLVKGLQRTGLKRNDYVESLLHAAEAQAHGNDDGAVRASAVSA